MPSDTATEAAAPTPAAAPDTAPLALPAPATQPAEQPAVAADPGPAEPEAIEQGAPEPDGPVAAHAAAMAHTSVLGVHSLPAGREQQDEVMLELKLGELKAFMRTMDHMPADPRLAEIVQFLVEHL